MFAAGQADWTGLQVITRTRRAGEHETRVYDCNPYSTSTHLLKQVPAVSFGLDYDVRRRNTSDPRENHPRTERQQGAEAFVFVVIIILPDRGWVTTSIPLRAMSTGDRLNEQQIQNLGQPNSKSKGKKTDCRNFLKSHFEAYSKRRAS